MSLRSMAIDAVLRTSRIVMRSYPRIVMYHRFSAAPSVRAISRDAFEAQVRLIRENYHPLSLDDFLLRLQGGGQMPANAVLLTIDDAYEDVYSIAMPILTRYKVPAIVYAPSGFVDRETWLWPDAVRYLLFATAKKSLQLHIAGQSQRWAWQSAADIEGIWNVVADFVKTLRRNDCIEALRQMAAELQVQLPAEPVEQFRAMSWDQLREWRAAGLDVGSHTCVHPTMSLESREVQARELNVSKARIEQVLQQPVRHFCYPFGGNADFSDATAELTAAAGYATAVTTEPGLVSAKDLYRIPRFGAAESLAEFQKVISGWRALSNQIEQRRATSGATRGRAMN